MLGTYYSGRELLNIIWVFKYFYHSSLLQLENSFFYDFYCLIPYYNHYYPLSPSSSCVRLLLYLDKRCRRNIKERDWVLDDYGPNCDLLESDLPILYNTMSIYRWVKWVTILLIRPNAPEIGWLEQQPHRVPLQKGSEESDCTRWAVTSFRWQLPTIRWPGQLTRVIYSQTACAWFGAWDRHSSTNRTSWTKSHVLAIWLGE